jgi:DNA-binding winged helix-turn-helix (wHTH) protein
LRPQGYSKATATDIRGDCRAYFLENPLTFQLAMVRTVFYENMPSRRQDGNSVPRRGYSHRKASELENSPLKELTENLKSERFPREYPWQARRILLSTT